MNNKLHLSLKKVKVNDDKVLYSRIPRVLQKTMLHNSPQILSLVEFLAGLNINGEATIEIQEQGRFEDSDSQLKCVQTVSPTTGLQEYP